MCSGLWGDPDLPNQIQHVNEIPGRFTPTFVKHCSVGFLIRAMWRHGRQNNDPPPNDVRFVAPAAREYVTLYGKGKLREQVQSSLLIS